MRLLPAELQLALAALADWGGLPGLVHVYLLPVLPAVSVHLRMPPLCYMRPKCREENLPHKGMPHTTDCPGCGLP